MYDERYFWYVNVTDGTNSSKSSYYMFDTKVYSQYTIKDSGTDSSTYVGVVGGLIAIPLIFIFKYPFILYTYHYP